MSWPPRIKRELLDSCGRHCCVCRKFCGNKIEIDHIIPESEGGPSTADNGIPVCFDCHQEIKSYNDKHPRGTKFTPLELRLHRERTFELVASGKLRRGMEADPISVPAWESTQLSTISSYAFPYPVPELDGEIDTEFTGRVFQRLQQIIGMAYWVTATTTPYDDFCYLLTFERTDVLTKGYRMIRIELHCHLTRFVSIVQRQCEYELVQETEGPPPELDSIPDDLALEMYPRDGHLIPHRINMHGPKSVLVRELVSRPNNRPPLNTTSGLLAFLHGPLNNKMIIWDDFEWTESTTKVMEFMVDISDHGFSFDQIKLDRNDPEQWDVPHLEK
ncbi:HNH endonuclease [Crateriforma conspicua]|uniref:HNH endonuclease n=1 Tax=Crateriforma conspicua TaxID=2527996 RepID=A0A5C6FM63_9PLAN|nr:HNH endonuclease signature motif containing protein [Crateriforma conspicua]TWU62374.1 HNH endonuclease [Crateriforma conspicua]